ncbi:Serine dehydratase alpha chain [Morganella morganii]|nr:Serine dehydratase alpha chain [Morganella morganii]
MGGAQLPAMSNSGSGNQGIAATQPVVVAEYLQADEEQLIRALTLSHLMAIYIHSQFPPLSALCAATTASMGPQPVSHGYLKGNMSRWRWLSAA